jgi:rare lipoprotein A (peptidoglycan hydrolase)
MKARHRHAVLAALAAGSVVVAPLAHASDDLAAPTAEDVKRAPAKPALDRSGRKRVGVASVYAHRFVGRKMADGTRMSADNDNAPITLPPRERAASD